MASQCHRRSKELRPVSTQETPFERAAFHWCAALLVAGVAVALAAVTRTSGVAGLVKLGNSAALSLFVIGKFIIFVGLHDDSPSIWSLAALVFAMDMCFAFLLASGLSNLERAPVLGAWLRRARGRAHDVLQKYPGLKRMAFFGVVAFVLLPIAGTGAITGSFVARILGLTRIAGVAAIALASAWTAVGFALLAQLLGEQAELLLRSPLFVGTTVVVAGVIGWYAYQRLLAMLRAQ